MKRRLPLLAALVALILTACQAPSSTELFVAAGERAADGYHFSLTLDTAQRYDFSFYAALVGRKLPSEPLPLTVTWLSPSRKPFTETLWLDLNGRRDSWFSRQLLAPYRRDVSVAEPGVWELTIALRETPALTGLGLRVEKTNDDGTRQTPQI